MQKWDNFEPYISNRSISTLSIKAYVLKSFGGGLWLSVVKAWVRALTSLTNCGWLKSFGVTHGRMHKDSRHQLASAAYAGYMNNLVNEKTALLRLSLVLPGRNPSKWYKGEVTIQILAQKFCQTYRLHKGSQLIENAKDLEVLYTCVSTHAGMC